MVQKAKSKYYKHDAPKTSLNADLTCSVQEEEAESRIGGGWRPWEQYPNITRLLLKSIFETHNYLKWFNGVVRLLSFSFNLFTECRM